MSRPKFLYEIEEKQLVLHSNTTKSCTLQQGDVLGRERNPDACIFLDRENAAGLRDALDQWLNEPE